jgi:serine/threonine protein kinase
MSSRAQVLNLRYFDSGGYGDLYLGQLRSNGGRVIVKFLREYRDRHARQAFDREVQILRRRLRGLVPVLSSDTNAQRPYYVMPYMAGGKLSNYAGRLSDEQLHAVARDLARILSNFHDSVGTHGDFKPANVLVAEDGKLNVADPSGNGFGCTMLFSQGVRGTPAYWAPEVSVKGISRAGDVHSYGATLYELVTGRIPREGQRLNPASEGYAVAPRIQEVIVCCCQDEADARPTMQEVVQMLEGTSWREIQDARKRTQDFLKGLGVIGAIVLGIAALIG